MKTVFVSGSNGQVGSYVCEKFLGEGYKVYGMRRRSSSLNTGRIDHFYQDPHIDTKFELVYGDLTDYASVSSLVADIKPDVFINCGAMSHVAVSFRIPCYTQEATGTSVVNCLEAIKQHSPVTRFVTMSSSEMFGSSPPPQSESTPFNPRSIYAVAKLTGYYATRHYRELGLFASNAICFNTESPRRGETFVTRKITRAATRIKLGLQDRLYLGNIEACRDWSHATNTTDALFKIALADKADDFCIGSGQSYSVQYFVEQVFGKLGLNWKDYVVIDPRYYRPTEVDALCCDNSKIRKMLEWEPKISFDALIEEMIESDLKLAQNEKMLKDTAKK